VREAGGTITFLPAPIYYYRRRVAATSLIDGIAANPDWYAPHLERVYPPLLKYEDDLRGRVPDFVKANILLSPMSKIRHVTGPPFDPDVLDTEQRAAFIDEMAKVMAHISIDDLRDIRPPGLPDIHRNALLYVYKEECSSRTLRILLMAAKKDETGTIFTFSWISPDGPCSVVRVLIGGQLSETPVATQTIKRLFKKPVITDHIMQISLMVS
jgi:hypothetical protein